MVSRFPDSEIRADSKDEHQGGCCYKECGLGVGTHVSNVSHITTGKGNSSSDVVGVFFLGDRIMGRRLIYGARGQIVQWEQRSYSC